MTDTQRVPGRGLAAAALAVLLAGAAAPAYADGKGKGDHGKKDHGKNAARSNTRSERATRSPQQAGSSADPAGNNGTMKVDGLAYDDGIDNEPHVTCEFRLTFFGFDEGQEGEITIAGHAPSGSGTVAQDDVLISDDAAAGGLNDRDAVVPYTMADLDLTGLTPHPKQGYHLKVTLRSDEGVKHKVFWLAPCEDQPEVGGETTTTTEEKPPTDVAGTTEQAPDKVPATTPTTKVLGVKLERPPAALAFTGSFAGLLTALGAALVAAGGLLVTVARRRRTA